jgi:hypothetical protein
LPAICTKSAEIVRQKETTKNGLFEMHQTSKLEAERKIIFVHVVSNQRYVIQYFETSMASLVNVLNVLTESFDEMPLM